MKSKVVLPKKNKSNIYSIDGQNFILLSKSARYYCLAAILERLEERRENGLLHQPAGPPRRAQAPPRRPEDTQKHLVIFALQRLTTTTTTATATHAHAFYTVKTR